MLEFALQYAGRGWPVFRLTGFKTPLKGSHGHLDATTDPETISRWWTERPKANIGLACGAIVVIDADGPEALKRLGELAAPHGGLPRTLTAQSARGFHFFFAAPAGVEIRSRNEPREKKGDDGIDVKGHGGYVALSPSVNAKNGFVYQWVINEPLAEMPAWLVSWCQNNKKQPSQPAFNPGELPAYIRAKLDQNSPAKQTLIADRLQDALRDQWSPAMEARVRSALLSIPARGYDRWREVGMALQSLGWDTPDGDRGFMLFDQWSATAPDEYSAAETERKWHSFGRRSGITIGTLFHMAEQAGWQGYYPETEVMPHNNGQSTELHKTTPHPFFASTGGAIPHANGHTVNLPEELSANNPGPLIELNKAYSVIGDLGGKCLVLGFVPSKVDDAILVPSFQSFQAFQQRYAHRRVLVQKQDKDGGWVEEAQQLGAAWLKWKGRRTYEGIDLDPDGPSVLEGNLMNLWHGFAVQPAAGRWDAMQRHILEVLADRSVEAARYIVRWAAWAVQNPGEPAEVALVFRGAKGSGKGTFARAIRQVFGQHGMQVFNPKHMVGQFNAHLRNCLLLYADEAFWAGDKQGESTLKGMITEPTIVIEQKGIDAIQWRNRLHVIMTANADWVVPASHDERRYCVFDVAQHHKQDEAYFAPIYEELANGGLAAMLHDLLAMDLGGWHPRQIVNTEALRAQKERSMSPLHEWYEGLLQDGVLPYIGKDTPDTCSANYLVGMARETTPRLRDLTPTALGRFLATMGVVKIHKASGNVWRFPPLGELRGKWEERFSGWRWDVEIEGWQVRH